MLSSRFQSAFVLCLLCLGAVSLYAKDTSTPVTPTGTFAKLRIPRLDRSPAIEDFLSMTPAPDLAASMLKVDTFTQRDPRDGDPASQKTELYLGYTDKSLYVAWICFDAEPSKIRAHMVRRELIDDDDQVGIVLDTFNDKKHAVFFFQNAYGIQQDGIWKENDKPDYSFDMIWRSAAKLTEQGYVAFFEIPFRSLRFPSTDPQTWGVFFERDIRRNNEFSFYPHITSNKQGFINQETQMDGMEKISPGRNLQFNPYVSGRTFRSLDDRDPNAPHFHGKHLEPRFGLDTKAVLKDAFVLDATINPDFAQVESDEPQVTVNQRFEVFFPEKRPFFLENSGYFDTPINLVFTRRIVDPEYGVRLTGKLGPWSIGTLFADDKSPGKVVPAPDPLAGHKAYYGILRVSHDIGKESSIGLIYTDRELHTSASTICTDEPCLVGFNRVGGIDARFKFSPTWQAYGQALTSSTKFNDGSRLAGPSYELYVQHSTRKVEWNALYRDTAPGFKTYTGFFRRPDIRRFSQFEQYKFRPEGKYLLWHGPSFFTANFWDHTGLRLQWLTEATYRVVFQRQTFVKFIGNIDHERLRPGDYPALPSNRDYAHHHFGVAFNSAWLKQFNIGGEVDWGTDTNFDAPLHCSVNNPACCPGPNLLDPANGCPPALANSSFAQLTATIRPASRLTIDNTYFLTRLQDRPTGASIFNNHILRSKWNYQFNREFSLRFIGQYNSTLANPALTSLQNAKNFNVDFLFTYLVHPGTAIYVGYNSNLQNLDPRLSLDPDGNLLRTRDRYINDGRQFFVKVSYLFRF